MRIQWNRVTWYSQVIAIVLFVGIFGLGFYLGMQFGKEKMIAAQPAVHPSGSNAIIATFKCDTGKEIQATFVGQSSVKLLLSDGREVQLPRAISANGARYANKNESVVFWNVGQTAFMTEGSSTTYNNCNQIAAPIAQ